MPYAANAETSIYYETFGSPDSPTLVLINGLGSQCINYRVPWIERFVGHGFHVVRMDNRDVGLSTKFTAVTPDVMGVVQALTEGREPSVPYTLRDMAADVVAVLDAVGVDRAHVFGVSMGGMIVQGLAMYFPERLLSITSVMSTTGDLDVGQASPEARAKLFGPPATNRDEAIANALAGYELWGSPGLVDVDAQRRLAGEAFDRCSHPEGVGRQMMAITANGSRTAALRDVDVPALVIHGDADTLIHWSGGVRTAESIPGAEFVLIEGMGHDYPEALWDRLVGLVSAHAQKATARQ